MDGEPAELVRRVSSSSRGGTAIDTEASLTVPGEAMRRPKCELLTCEVGRLAASWLTSVPGYALHALNKVSEVSGAAQ